MNNTQRYSAFFIAALFYAFVMLTRNLPVIVADTLCQKFHMSEIVFGQYRGLYYFTYCLAHLPMAYMLDRFGPRLIITISVGLCVLGLLPMVWSSSVWILIFGRMLLGLGSSAGILSIFKINRAFFKPGQFAKMLGIAGTMGYASSVLGLSPLRALFISFGYEHTLLLIYIVGVVLSLSAFLLIKPVDLEKPKGFFKSLMRLIGNPYFWIVSLVGGLIIWSTEGFADGWSTPLLMNLFAQKMTMAVGITSIIPIGFAVGSIILPWFADTPQKSKTVFGRCALLSSVGLLCLFIPNLPWPGIILAYAVIGLSSAYQVICIDLGGKVVPESLSTLSSAATNMLIMSFGYLFHTVSAVLMNGKGVVDPTCSALMYKRLDLFIGLMPFILSGIIAYLINARARYDLHIGKP